MLMVNGTNIPLFKRFGVRSDKRMAFFQGFLKNPRQVGSVIPSSRFLERRLVHVSEVADAELVVELGPGTGGTTRAILRALAPTARLLAIEANPEFADLLEAEPDPRLIVHHGSAEEIGKILKRHQLPAPDVVLSGIPFSTMDDDLGKRILVSVWEALNPDGRFVAYQFRDAVKDIGTEILGDPETDRELFNIPPMRFYRWNKAQQAGLFHGGYAR